MCNYINSFSVPNWGFNNKYIFQNEYDDQSRFVKTTYGLYTQDGGELVLSVDSESIREYQYECEDWLAQETLARTQEGLGNGSRHVYHYEGKDECFEIEESDLEIAIYPNPTSGNITINSPVFQSGNTMIFIFDISGKLLLEEKEIGRMEKVEMDLGHLPNGIYVVQLLNQNHFVQQKVIVRN